MVGEGTDQINWFLRVQQQIQRERLNGRMKELSSRMPDLEIYSMGLKGGTEQDPWKNVQFNLCMSGFICSVPFAYSLYLNFG